MCALGISGAAPQLTSGKREVWSERQKSHTIWHSKSPGEQKHLSNACHFLQVEEKVLF